MRRTVRSYNAFPQGRLDGKKKALIYLLTFCQTDLMDGTRSEDGITPTQSGFDFRAYWSDCESFSGILDLGYRRVRAKLWGAQP